ncbi:MAG TPA: tetratricopeptide repeat protein [Ignavibacteria bacterium]|nr:tetratricopeptide repeat protein [Ignavibacteria bacterium]
MKEKKADTLTQANSLLEQAQTALKNEHFNDSLELLDKAHALYKKADDDEGIANCLGDIGMINSRLGNFKVALDSLLKCVEIRERLNNEIQTSRTYNQLANCFVNLGETDEAIKYYQQSLTINEKINYTKGISTNSLNLGNLYKDIGKFDDATKLFYKALEIDLKNNDKEGLALSYSSIGNLNAHTGDLYSALDFYFKALNVQEELNRNQSRAITLNNIGNVYKNLEEYDLALENYKKAYDILNSLGIKRWLSQILNNMGVIHSLKKDFNQAFLYQEKSLALAKEIGDKNASGYALTKIAEVVSELKHENPDKYFDEAIAINSELKNQTGLANVYLNMGVYYFRIKNYKKAEEYFILSLKISKENKLNTVLIDIYKYMSELSSIKKDFENAYVYHEKYSQIKDALFKDEYNKRISDMKIKYEKEKQEKLLYNEIEEQKNKLEIFYNELKIKNEILLENEKMLKESKEKAEEMSKLKSNFLANMSHELRTPMNGILGLSVILKELSGKNTEEYELSETINESAERLMNSINQLLEFSELENSDYNLKYAKFNLMDLIYELMTTFKKKAEKKKISLNLITSKPLIIVNLDKYALRKILVNIIDNAIKFTSSKGKVDIILYQDENFLIIKVSDTGIGIAPDQMEFIFDSFRQGSEGLVRKYEGSGLGLSITKRLVESMKGKIEVESKEGKGATFIIKFKKVF